MINNTVVVLNYNDWKTTKELIEKIYDYKSIDKIIIVDNLSTDDSVLQLNKILDSKVELLISDKNGGYAYGNDLGCRHAMEKYETKYLTIANPDIYFEDDVLIKILEYHDNSDNAGIVGCKMKCHSDISIPSAWKIPKYKDCIMENLLILRRILGNKLLYKDSYMEDDCVKVDVVAGSFFTIKSDTYKLIDGFDTNTFLYYEENILAYKLAHNGYVNYILNKFQYDHYHSISINNTFSSKKQKLDIAYKSRRYFIMKYLKVSKAKNFLHSFTYYLGLFNYLILDKVRQVLVRN